MSIFLNFLSFWIAPGLDLGGPRVDFGSPGVDFGTPGVDLRSPKVSILHVLFGTPQAITFLAIGSIIPPKLLSLHTGACRYSIKLLSIPRNKLLRILFLGIPSSWGIPQSFRASVYSTTAPRHSTTLFGYGISLHFSAFRELLGILF